MPGKGGAKKTFKLFEKSGADKDPKGLKEGSKKEEALDRKQFNKFKKGK